MIRWQHSSPASTACCFWVDTRSGELRAVKTIRFIKHVPINCQCCTHGHAALCRILEFLLKVHPFGDDSCPKGWTLSRCSRYCTERSRLSGLLIRKATGEKCVIMHDALCSSWLLIRKPAGGKSVMQRDGFCSSHDPYQQRQ